MHIPMHRDHLITSMPITFSRNVIKGSTYVIISKNIHLISFIGVFNRYFLIFHFDGITIPTATISMRKLKEILRLKYGTKLTHRQISKSLSISPLWISTYA